VNVAPSVALSGLGTGDDGLPLPFDGGPHRYNRLETDGQSLPFEHLAPPFILVVVEVTAGVRQP
jgi:hypothetical protein